MSSTTVRRKTKKTQLKLSSRKRQRQHGPDEAKFGSDNSIEIKARGSSMHLSGVRPGVALEVKHIHGLSKKVKNKMIGEIKKAVKKACSEPHGMSRKTEIDIILEGMRTIKNLGFQGFYAIYKDLKREEMNSTDWPANQKRVFLLELETHLLQQTTPFLKYWTARLFREVLETYEYKQLISKEEREKKLQQLNASIAKFPSVGARVFSEEETQRLSLDQSWLGELHEIFRFIVTFPDYGEAPVITEDEEPSDNEVEETSDDEDDEEDDPEWLPSSQ
jgi:hypothetical protein